MTYTYTITPDSDGEVMRRLMMLQETSPDSIISITDNGDGTATAVTALDLESPLPEEERESLTAERTAVMKRLAVLDYIGVKIATGRATADEYTEEIALMSAYADRINEIDERLAELEVTDSEE